MHIIWKNALALDAFLDVVTPDERMHPESVEIAFPVCKIHQPAIVAVLSLRLNEESWIQRRNKIRRQS
jgi:hypothetical protein